MEIRSKSENYQQMFAGRFGNRPQSWVGYQALVDSNYRGPVSMRSRTKADPFAYYNIAFAELLPLLQSKARSPESLVFSEAMPHDKNVIQGEVLRTHNGLCVEYTFAAGPMREALQAQRLMAVGLRANLLLQHYLDPYDYDQLLELLDDFPGHVVEFSAFRVPVGTLCRRVIFWEIRLY